MPQEHKLLRSQKQHHHRMKGGPVFENHPGAQSRPPTEEVVQNATKTIG